MSPGSNSVNSSAISSSGQTMTDPSIGLRTLIQMLPDDEQRVMELRYLERKSHSEIACVLGCTVESTRALWSRAVARLQLAIRHVE